MSTPGPFTASELAALKALAELHADSDQRALETLRLIRMIEARDLVIRELDLVIRDLNKVLAGDVRTTEDLETALAKLQKEIEP